MPYEFSIGSVFAVFHNDYAILFSYRIIYVICTFPVVWLIFSFFKSVGQDKVALAFWVWFQF